MKKIHINTIALLLISTFISSCKTSRLDQEKDFINYEWASDNLWDDGQAEVAIYEATKNIYDESRSFEYAYILVKEEFNESFKVKTDDYQRNDLYPVMKINKFCRVETLIYPYHFLTSVFVHRGNPESLHKLSHTSQEWCGNTSKQFLEKGSKYQYDYMSYFDGEGTGQTKIVKGPWFEDQLSYTLRTLKFREGLEFEVDLYPSQVNNKAQVPEPVKANVKVSKSAELDLAGIDSLFIENPWKVSIIKKDNSKLDFWFNSIYPNYLLKMKASDGRSLLLKEITRDKYWAHQ